MDFSWVRENSDYEAIETRLEGRDLDWHDLAFYCVTKGYDEILDIDTKAKSADTPASRRIYDVTPSCFGKPTGCCLRTAESRQIIHAFQLQVSGKSNSTRFGNPEGRARFGRFSDSEDNGHGLSRSNAFNFVDRCKPTNQKLRSGLPQS
jgi:hypothetical protein